MAVPVYVGDRVLVSTDTTGTGTYDLGTAVSGYLTPANAGVTTGVRVAYVVVDSLTNPSTFEVGEGTYTAGSPATISRTLIVRNSSGGTSAVSWSAGTKYLFLAPSASRFVMYDSDGGMTLNTHLTLVSGAAASVAVSTPGDRNTGLFFPGENKVALTSGASTIFEVADKVSWTSNEARGPNIAIYGNQINEWATDASAEVAVNYNGYNNGTTRFRDLAIYDGKNGLIVKFVGADKSATFEGSLGAVKVASINSGPLAGFRNAVINGNFDIWQRGTSFSNPAAGAYGSDRWLINFDGSGATRTISRQAFTLGQTDVPGEPTYFYRFNQSVAGSGGTFNVIVHRIEDVRTFAGQQVTLSFYAKAAASLTMQVVKLRQNFGSGGSPSAFVDTDFSASTVVGTSFTKYTFTVTLPSISGKTLGTDNNSSLDLIFALPINTTFTFDLAQVQLEVGSVATPFERRPLGVELALCQRYYWKTFPLATAPAQNAGTTGAYSFGVLLTNGNALYQGLSFPVAMRAAPTMTGYNPSAANAQARNTTFAGDFSSTTVIATGNHGFHVTATAAANFSQGSASYLHITAESEL